ncbi:MAG TPA: hypothetical protein VG184_07550 [Acidimicrobiales bacterium]|nr:hypothetical protein [Acidimicrobiales bacterium]
MPVAEQEGVELRVAVRHRGGCRVVDLALVNAQPVPSEAQDAARLYQVCLTVTAADGAAAVFVGHNDPDLGELPAVHDDERLRLALLHRGGASTPTATSAPSTPRCASGSGGRGGCARPASPPSMSASRWPPGPTACPG